MVERHPLPTSRPASVAWSGELLWPQELPDGELIDLSGVAALGTWVHEWFRARPGRAVTRASPLVRRQLLRAGVPVVWADPSHITPPGGITVGERNLLLGNG